MSIPTKRFFLCCSKKVNRHSSKNAPSSAAAATPIKVKSVQFKPLPLENRQDSTHFSFQESDFDDVPFNEHKASIPPPPPLPPPPPPPPPVAAQVKKSASGEMPAALTASIAKEAALKANAIQQRRLSKSRHIFPI